MKLTNSRTITLHDVDLQTLYYLVMRAIEKQTPAEKSLAKSKRIQQWKIGHVCLF
jgi:hypothetical protein